MSQEEREGYDDYWSNIPEKACPFESSSTNNKASDWLRGWNLAFDREKMDL